MLISRLRILCYVLFFILPFHRAGAYSLTGVNTTFNFGTIASPFPDLTLSTNTICVAFAFLAEPDTYFVRATSSSSATTAFQLTNGTNNTYKLNYSVSWAGSAGGSPTFVSLSSGQNSSSTFTAQVIGTLNCPQLPANASLQLRLLGANQMLAKQGTYTDTLTILIVASA